MRILILAVSLLACALVIGQQTPPASSTQAIYTAQANSCQRKFDHIRQNGSKARPDQSPTVISEGELNAWLASGNAELPQGVKRLQVTGTPGVIRANAFVDFDEITAERRSSNPLLALFRGTHEVQATAHSTGSGGQGQVHIDTVSLDGVNVPRVALEYFVEKYVTAKHPGIGLDSQFQLPYRIDIATVGSHQLTMTQK